jgi:hypothetical protein
MDDMNVSKLRSAAVLAAALMSVATLGTACGVNGTDEGKDATAEIVSEQDEIASSADDGTASTTTTPDADASSGSGSVDVSGVELPRTVRYTGLDVTVDGAEAVTDANQGSGVALSLTVKNTLEVGWNINPLSIALVDGDGTRLQATGFDDPDDPEAGFPETYEVEVISGGQIKRKAFIPVEGGLDLSEATLSVADEGVLPAEVPLAGEVPERPFPLPVTVPSEPGTVGGVLGAPLTITVQSAELTDETDYGLRAEEGTHLLFVKFRTVGSGQGAVLTSSTLRIVVDGAPNDSIDLNGQEFHVDSVGGGEGKDNTAAFALRDDYEEVSLLGTSDTAFVSEFPDHTFPITVPPLPED